MKTFNTIFKIAGLDICAILLVLTGCILDAPASGPSAGNGTVQLNIAGDTSGTRTLFPVLDGVSYTISAVQGGTTIDSTTTSFELAAGTWDFTIDAKKGGTSIGTASKTGVVIAAGETTKVSVILTPVTGGANGTLRWEITVPSGLIEQKLEYSDNNGTTWTTLADTVVDMEEGSEALPAGSYLVRSFLEGNAGQTGDIEAFHIYSGLTTVLNWEYRADSLVEHKPLSGTVTLTSPSATISAVRLELKGDAGMSTQILPMTESGGAWTFATEIPETTNTLSGTLFVSTANNGSAEIEAPFTGVSYAANVTLPEVTIYTVTASISGQGTLSVNGIALAHDAKRDILAGATVTLTINAATGWRLGGLQWGAAAYTSPVTITADTTAAAEFIEGMDPNVFFEWNQNVDPWTGLTQANNAVAGKSSAYPDVSVAVFGGNGAPAGPKGIGPIGNVRLSIGQTKGNTANPGDINGVTVAGDTFLTDRGGQFDLSSRPFRATIGYADFSGTSTSNNWIRFSLHNTGTGQATSPLDNSTGNRSYFAEIPATTAFPIASQPTGTGRTYYFLDGSTLQSGTIILEVDPVAAYGDFEQYPILQNTFFVVAVGSAANATITSIKLEYTDDAGPLTAVKIYNEKAGAKVGAGKLVPATLDLDVGDELELIAKTIPATPDPASGAVVWSTGNSAAVTVDTATGAVEAVGIGTATITATIDGESSSVDIAVGMLVATGVNITGTGVTGTPKTLQINLAGESTATSQLNASILPAGAPGTIDWSSSNSNVVAVDNGLLTAKAETSGTPVTITATVRDTSYTDTVEVTVVNDTSVDPNLIFEWIYTRDGAPAGTWSSAGTPNTTLPGIGTAVGTFNSRDDCIPITYRGGTITIDSDPVTGGIVLDGSSTTTGANLLIGTNTVASTVAGTGTAENPAAATGVLNLNHTAGVKVTLGFEILSPSVFSGETGTIASRGFNVIIQNSGTTAGNSPLNGGTNGKPTPVATASNIARIAYIATPSSTSATASPGTHDSTLKTLVCRTIDPTDFNQVNIGQLSTAFLGITQLGTSGTTTGAKVIIRSIRIEKL